jgi:hypothetical protein
MVETEWATVDCLTNEGLLSVLTKRQGNIKKIAHDEVVLDFHIQNIEHLITFGYDQGLFNELKF